MQNVTQNTRDFRCNIICCREWRLCSQRAEKRFEKGACARATWRACTQAATEACHIFCIISLPWVHSNQWRKATLQGGSRSEFFPDSMTSDGP
jgi:hypothetical protein